MPTERGGHAARHRIAGGRRQLHESLAGLRLDVDQVGVTHVEATLNRDHGERQPEPVPRCGQGVMRDTCTAAGNGVYRILARGLMLPPGLVLSP